MPHFNRACQNEVGARAVCDAIVKLGQGVVAITMSPNGLPTVWYRCVEDEQIIQKVRSEINAAESSAMSGPLRMDDGRLANPMELDLLPHPAS